MKGIVYKNTKMTWNDVNLIGIKENWTRIKVKYSGLCGSDIQKIKKIKNEKRGKYSSIILGHEFVGEVVGINGYTDSIHIGDRVVGIPLIPCDECDQCLNKKINLCSKGDAIGRTLNGSFAEFVDIPIKNAIVIPKSIEYREAVLTDVVAVCIHAINLINESVVKKEVLVIGDGAIGCTLSVLLTLMGANVTLKGKHNPNLKFLKSNINDLTIKESDEALGNFSFIFETVGRNQSKTLSECVEKIRKNGKVVVLGVFEENYNTSFNGRELFIKEAEIMGANSYDEQEFLKALNIIGDNKEIFTKLITHEFVFEDFEKALDTLSSKKEATIKIIFRNSEDHD